MTKEKLLKGKQQQQAQKQIDDKNRKAAGSLKSRKSKGPTKDSLQLEKERIRALKEQEKKVENGLHDKFLVNKQ